MSVSPRSGDDIRRQPILEHNDPVTKRQLTFFQASDLQFVRWTNSGERVNRRFKIMMFEAQTRQLHPHCLCFRVVGGSVRRHAAA